jgi:hypothetical protein
VAEARADKELMVATAGTAGDAAGFDLVSPRGPAGTDGAAGVGAAAATGVIGVTRDGIEEGWDWTGTAGAEEAGVARIAGVGTALAAGGVRIAAGAFGTEGELTAGDGGATGEGDNVD